MNSEEPLDDVHKLYCHFEEACEWHNLNVSGLFWVRTGIKLEKLDLKVLLI